MGGVRRHKTQDSTYFSKKVFKMRRPVDPLFSGWNWVANTLPFCTAEMKLVPYVVSVKAQGAASGEGMARYECTKYTSSSGLSAWMSLVCFCINRPFQPMWGTESLAEESKRLMVPLMMPSPFTPGVSSLPSNSVCMPRQIPKKGRSARMYSRKGWVKPLASRTSMALPKLPTPGKTITSAELISSGLWQMGRGERGG